MNLSTTKLKTIQTIIRGKNSTKEIQLTINKSKSQTYKILNELKKEKIITINKLTVQLEIKTHLIMLAKLLDKYEQLIQIFSTTGIEILSKLTKAKTTQELINETKFHKTTILNKINKNIQINLIIKKKKKYSLNKLIWPEVFEFIEELNKYETEIDSRIPLDATIYFKNSEEILFSTTKKATGELSAFSNLEQFGIELFNNKNYYYIPQKKLSKEEIFKHCLLILKKENSIQNKIITIIVYLKFKEQFKQFKEETLVKFACEILKGKKITNYPSLEEIKERAKVYNIQI